MKMMPLLVVLLLAGCVTQEQREQEAQQQVQAFIAHCNYLGYFGYEERRCVLNLIAQENARDAAQTDAFLRGFNQSRPIQTQCQQDALGRVNCATR